METISRKKAPRSFGKFTAVEVVAAGVISASVCVSLISAAAQARDEARRRHCRNQIYSFSHACWGDVVRLDGSFNIASVSVSGCPMCGWKNSQSPLRPSGLIRFQDSRGQFVCEATIPPDRRDIAYDELKRFYQMRWRWQSANIID